MVGQDKTARPKTGRKTKPKLYPILKWLRGAGIAAEFFGWGGLLLAWWFWPAVVVIYLGFVLLSLDLWFEPDLRKTPLWRIGGITLMVLFAVAFSLGIVFVNAPLGVSAMMTDAEYPAGTVIAGIAWKPQFTEVQIWINNSSDRNYDDLDLVVRPSSAVAAIAQLTNLPGVSFEDKNGLGVRLMDINPTKSTSNVVPLILLATDAGYRIRCPHFPAKTMLKIVIALADIKWNPPANQSQIPIEQRVRDRDYILRLKFDDFSTYWQGHQNGDVYAPRPTSGEWMKVEGSYTVAERRRDISQRIAVGGELTIKQQ